MKRILAMLLSVICALSFTCVSTYADEKSEDEEKAASIAESYLSAAAKNMWLYESNNLAEHTIQELVDPSGNSLLSDMSADVNTQKILSSMDNITFVQEKSKYFREMRQRQDIQRNDFALEYTVTSASIEDNVATLSIIEHISFHYSSFPDTLSELVNYYDVDLIKCNGSWYVSDVTSTNDDFDAIYKGSEFTAEKADEIIALRDAHSLNDTSAIEAIMDDYNLSDNSNATLAGSTTWYNYNATNATAYAYTYVSQMFGKSNWSDFDDDAKKAGRSYYNQNFYDWGQGESPLRRRNLCINTRKQYEREINSIARKGQGRNSLAGAGQRPAGVQRQRLWRLLLHKKRDVRTRTSPQNQKSSCAMSSPHWSLECALM